jgi:hypothetical protein
MAKAAAAGKTVEMGGGLVQRAQQDLGITPLSLGADGAKRASGAQTKMIRSAKNGGICKEHPRAFVDSHSQVWSENFSTLPSDSMMSWFDLNETLKPEREGE